MVQGENVVVVCGGGGWVEKIWRSVQGIFPHAVVVKLCLECFVGSFA